MLDIKKKKKKKKKNKKQYFLFFFFFFSYLTPTTLFSKENKLVFSLFIDK